MERLFPSDFVREATLSDGTKVRLRMLRPADRERLVEAFGRLSATSRYRRFLAPTPELKGKMLDYLLAADGEDHVAIGMVTADDAERGVGIGRFVRFHDEPHVAEAAITVTDDFQGKGAGKILLAVLSRAAAERGVDTFRAELLANNVPMRELITHYAEIVRASGDEGVAVLDVKLPRAEDIPLPGEPVTPGMKASDLYQLFVLAVTGAFDLVTRFYAELSELAGKRRPNP